MYRALCPPSSRVSSINPTFEAKNAFIGKTIFDKYSDMPAVFILRMAHEINPRYLFIVHSSTEISYFISV